MEKDCARYDGDACAEYKRESNLPTFPYHLAKHQERAGHASASPTETSENVHGGHSLRQAGCGDEDRKKEN